MSEGAGRSDRLLWGVFGVALAMVALTLATTSFPGSPVAPPGAGPTYRASLRAVRRVATTAPARAVAFEVPESAWRTPRLGCASCTARRTGSSSRVTIQLIASTVCGDLDDALPRSAAESVLQSVLDKRLEDEDDTAVTRVLQRSSPHEQARSARELAVHMDRERAFATRLVARVGGRHYFVRVRDVDWMESAANYVRIRACGSAHLVRQTMKELEARLDPAQFVRIHRSTIVAIDRIRTIQGSDNGEYLVTMADGARLVSSRSFSARVRELLR
jgi:hypothetical protein